MIGGESVTINEGYEVIKGNQMGTIHEVTNS